jgi:mannose-6-phosphate isomerase-like protein (cupin superfamily)
MSPHTAPFAVAPGEGPTMNTMIDAPVTIKAHTGNTGGSLTVLEFVHAPHAGPPLHVHHREDELWYVLDGDYRFKAGDSMFQLSTGGVAFVPRGTPHCFQKLGDTPGRMLSSTRHRESSGSSSNTRACCPGPSTRNGSPPSPKRTGWNSWARPLPPPTHCRTRRT